jgi:hypothetical protein
MAYIAKYIINIVIILMNISTLQKTPWATFSSLLHCKSSSLFQIFCVCVSQKNIYQYYKLYTINVQVNAVRLTDCTLQSIHATVSTIITLCNYETAV